MAIRGKALVRSAAIYTAANMLSSGVPFALLPLLTRAFSPSDYGIVSMFMVSVSVLNAFTGANVHGAISVRYFKRAGGVDLPRYVGTCLGILASTSFALIAIVTLFQRRIEALTGIPAPWLIVAVLVSAAQFIVYIRLAVWQARGQALRYGSFQVAQSVANVLLTLLLVFGAGMRWPGRLTGIAAANLGAMLLGLWLLWRARDVRAEFDRGYAGDALRFGVPLIPHSVGAFLLSGIGPTVLTNTLGVAAAGIYNVTVQMGMILAMATTSFNSAYAPWLYTQLRTSSDAANVRIVRLAYLYFVALILAAVVLGMTAPVLLTVIVGPAFQRASEGVIFVALGFAFGGMYLMITNLVFFSEKTYWVSLTTLGSGAINVAASTILIRAHGVRGAAQAFLVAQAFLFLGVWVIAQRVHPMPWLRALRWGARPPEAEHCLTGHP